MVLFRRVPVRLMPRMKRLFVRVESCRRIRCPCKFSPLSLRRLPPTANTGRGANCLGLPTSSTRENTRVGRSGANFARRCLRKIFYVQAYIRTVLISVFYWDDQRRLKSTGNRSPEFAFILFNLEL